MINKIEPYKLLKILDDILKNQKILLKDEFDLTFKKMKELTTPREQDTAIVLVTNDEEEEDNKGGLT